MKIMYKNTLRKLFGKIYVVQTNVYACIDRQIRKKLKKMHEWKNDNSETGLINLQK